MIVVPPRLCVLILVASVGLSRPVRSAVPFLRSDANADGATNLSDGLFMLQHLFASGAAPPCMKSFDANDDGRADVADAAYTLAYLFAAGPVPYPPFHVCGFDPTVDTLPCDAFLPCSSPLTQEVRTAILGYGSLSEPDQSRLHAWISARFDPHAVIMDLGAGHQISFEGLTHLFYLAGSSSFPHPRVRKRLYAWLLGGPGRWLIWVGPDGEFFDFSEWGFQLAPGVRTGGSEVLRYAGKSGAVVEVALSSHEKLCAIVTDPARARTDATWGPGSDNGLLITGIRDGVSAGVIYAGFRVAGPSVTRYGAHLAFLDLVHGIYPGRANDVKRMVIRFEDVSARCNFDDPRSGPSVMAAARYLAGEGIPYALALIPAHLEFDPPLEKHISPHAVSLTGSDTPYDPEFREYVLAAMNLSPESVIVLHGFSHQYGQGVTGVDAEFCVYEGSPPACSAYVDVSFAAQRVRLALREAEEAGLMDPGLVGTNRVIGWETPHYEASPAVRSEVFEPSFSFFFEPAWWEATVPALAQEAMTFFFIPYVVTRSGETFLNAYHEYVALRREEEDAARIIAEAAILSSLRYEVESAFFFHAHLIELTYLEQIVEGLKAQGWEFPPLRTLLPVSR